MTKIIAIGDVHGCSKELDDLLDKLAITEQDQLVFLGDLVNRGSDSRGVLDRVHKLRNKCCIMGNHELRLLQYREHGDQSKLKAYDRKTLDCLNDEDWQLFEAMKTTYYCKEYDTVFVHGGFVPKIPWEEQPVETVSRVQVIDKNGKGRKRSKYPDCPHWSNFWLGPPFVVYGHMPMPQIQRTTWTLGIDTSCVLGGFLTAYILPSKEIVQVPAHKAYIKK